MLPGWKTPNNQPTLWGFDQCWELYFIVSIITWKIPAVIITTQRSLFFVYEYFVTLLGSYVLLTFRNTSGQVHVYKSEVTTLWCHGEVIVLSLGYPAACTIPQYLTQSQYPDTELTSHWPYPSNTERQAMSWRVSILYVIDLSRPGIELPTFRMGSLLCTHFIRI